MGAFIAFIVFIFRQIKFQFGWINRANWKFVAIGIPHFFYHSAMITLLPKVLADQIGKFHMTVVISSSGILAIIGHNLAASRVFYRFGNDRISRIALPLYAANLLLFFFVSVYAFIPLGFISGIVFTSLDALFRQGVNERTKSKVEADIAIGAKEFLASIAAGIAALAAGWLVATSRWAWITLILTTVTIAYVWVWQVRLHSPRELCKEPEKESKIKSRHLYKIATPYLGMELAASLYVTFVPLFIADLKIAGLVLLCYRFSAAFANLLANKWYQHTDGKTIFRQCASLLPLGILLIPLGQMSQESIPLYIGAAVLIGVTYSCSKMMTIHLLKESVPSTEQAKAIAPIFTIAEGAYLISMPIFGWLTAQMSNTLIWLIIALLPVLFLLLSRFLRDRK
jgi:predicted MFS family arabinose efflux permease